MTPRSTFALALCAYIAAVGAMTYRRGGAEHERRQPSGRAAAPELRSETAAAGLPPGVNAGGGLFLPRRLDPPDGAARDTRLPAALSHHPNVIRWLPLVERVLAEQQRREP